MFSVKLTRTSMCMCNVIMKPHIRWATVALASWVKRPEPEADRSSHMLCM